MKLTKLQRHTFYILLHEFKRIKAESDINGLCFVLEKFDRSANESSDDDLEIEQLPELIKRKPDVCGGYWFPKNKEGKKMRIKILKECIEETY